MKRVLLAILGTIAGVSALLSFKTHAPDSTRPSLPSAGLPEAAGADATAAGAAAGGPAAASGAAPARRAAKKVHRAPQPASTSVASRPAGAAPGPGDAAGTGPGSSHASTRPAVPRPGTAPPPAAATAAPPGPTTAPPSTAPPTTAPPSTAPPAPRTFTGQPIKTRYGTVQVQVTVTGTRITNVAFVQLTATDSRSQQINQNAAPTLLQQTLAAQSARIDGVSGATYTSDGYKQSLQSALDQAG